jgi:ATP-dependent Clp protease ATP-binding subunit ClpA
MQYTNSVSEMMKLALQIALKMRHEFVTPEHFFRSLLMQSELRGTFNMIGDTDLLIGQLDYALSKMEQVPENKVFSPELSMQAHEVLGKAFFTSKMHGGAPISVLDILLSMLTLKDSTAQHLLNGVTLDQWERLIREQDKGYIQRLKDGSGKSMSDMINLLKHHLEVVVNGETHPEEDDEYYVDDEFDEVDEMMSDSASMLTCISDMKSPTKVIGRETEIEATLEVLCRKENNNVIHVGESGVGKTTLIYAIAKYLRKNTIPSCLKGFKVYLLNMSNIIAGAQYRGEAERRLSKAFDALKRRKKAILFIDDIHSLVSLGQSNDGYSDIVGVLKKNIDENDIRIIGTTSASEYQKYLERHKSLMCRFQQVIIEEPDTKSMLKILTGVKAKYERHHNLTIGLAVRKEILDLSQRYMPNEKNPQKAIKLMDAAGAYQVMFSGSDEQKELSTDSVLKALSRMCNISNVENVNDMQNLLTLSDRMKIKIYGQDTAIDMVVDAIQVSKAGLVDDNKPIASLLFVGPTGVGKTEVAKTLSEELGVKLIRFDMSEYVEKHAVAKLIGSPAGYIGYDDGGLLTDAIHKDPYCVLLLDEIEKAHSDIYNILLQIMDYGYLTDNKGKKVNFRHVVIIMTSNAGAQYAHVGASMGFAPTKSKGDVMKKDLKMLFKPEFINRLSGTVVFKDMDDTMARLILEKKLNALGNILVKKNIKITVSAEAFNYMLQKGSTKEYGAREFDRIISTELRPLFVKAILSVGQSKNRKIIVKLQDGALKLDESKK